LEDKEDEDDKEEDEDEDEDEELFCTVISLSARPITSEMLALILRCCPNAVAKSPEHPISVLLDSYEMRNLTENEGDEGEGERRTPYTEDELVALLATLVEDPTVQVYAKHGENQPLEELRERVEDWDDAGDRILQKIKDHPAPNKHVALPTPTTPEVAEPWLASTLLSSGFLPVRKSTAEVNTAVDLLSDAALARVITVENSKHLLLKWGSHDCVNRPELQILQNLSRLPTEVVRSHSAAILSRVDEDILDDGERYSFHENYQYLWQNVCKGLAIKDPEALTSYAKATLLPRLQAKEEDEDKLLTVAMLEDIAAESPECLSSFSAEILAAMEGLSQDGDFGLDGTKVSKLRESLQAQDTGKPPAKKQRVESK